MAQHVDSTVQTRPFSIDEVQPFLLGVSYPATKREILDVAYDNGAPDRVLDVLNRVPDQEYYGETDFLFTLEDMQDVSLVS